ncbi:MAG: tetratricopeptide repeat protein [Gemmatimonadetes bacterium]|nr:tetratricopeptide repeat protein [Gemmatimonadota bacterium]
MGTKKKQDNVIPFPGAGQRVAFERVKAKRVGPESQAQLGLFETRNAEILPLGNLSSFELALRFDENGDDRAIEYYEKAIAEGDAGDDAYSNLGIIYTKSGDTVSAFDCFTRSLLQNPRHFESHYNLANLYFESGDVRMSRLHYEFAGRLEPEFPNVYFNLGLIYAVEENFPKAMEALSRFKALVPEEEGRKADELLISLQLSVTPKS